MEIKISPEQIDALVRDKIMQSAFGKTIEAAIIKAFSGYNNPVDEAIKQAVNQAVRELLQTEYKESLFSAVRKVLEERITQTTLETYANATAEKLLRAAEDRY